MVEGELSDRQPQVSGILIPFSQRQDALLTFSCIHAFSLSLPLIHPNKCLQFNLRIHDIPPDSKEKYGVSVLDAVSITMEQFSDRAKRMASLHGEIDAARKIRLAQQLATRKKVENGKKGITIIVCPALINQVPIWTNHFISEEDVKKTEIVEHWQQMKWKHINVCRMSFLSVSTRRD